MDPKPPSPRSVSSRDSTCWIVTRTTGHITNWAILTPGFISTEMTEVLSDDIKDGINAKIPMKRMGRASEIAEATAFLLSDHSSYITGETLKVNGGMNMA